MAVYLWFNLELTNDTVHAGFSFPQITVRFSDTLTPPTNRPFPSIMLLAYRLRLPELHQNFGQQRVQGPLIKARTFAPVYDVSVRKSPAGVLLNQQRD